MLVSMDGCGGGGGDGGREGCCEVRSKRRVEVKIWRVMFVSALAVAVAARILPFAAKASPRAETREAGPVRGGTCASAATARPSARGGRSERRGEGEGEGEGRWMRERDERGRTTHMGELTRWKKDDSIRLAELNPCS